MDVKGNDRRRCELNVECSSSTEDWLREGADYISRLYRVGYGDGSINEELDGWADEGDWLEG